jgi:hypothetical protein
MGKGENVINGEIISDGIIEDKGCCHTRKTGPHGCCGSPPHSEVDPVVTGKITLI